MKILAIIFYYYRRKDDEKIAYLSTLFVLVAFLFALLVPFVSLIFGKHIEFLGGNQRIIRYIIIGLFFVLPTTYLLKKNIPIEQIKEIKLSSQDKKNVTLKLILIFFSLMGLFAFQAFITKKFIEFLLTKFI